MSPLWDGKDIAQLGRIGDPLPPAPLRGRANLTMPPASLRRALAMLPADVRAERAVRQQTLREASAEAGVARDLFMRVEHGQTAYLRVDSLAKLLTWLEAR